MGGETAMRHVATRALLWAGGAAFFFVLSCGEPTAPGSPRWVHIGTFPAEFADVKGISATPDRVYTVCRIIQSGISKNVIYGFSGSSFIEEYVLPYPAADAALMDIKFARGVGWAVGGRSVFADEVSEASPIIIIKKNDVWEEVQLPASGLRWINKVFPVTADEAWLLSDDSGSDVGGDLFKYERGVIREFPEFGFVLAAYAPEADILYVLKNLRAGEAELFITYDRGDTWLKERITFPLPGGYKSEGVKRIYAVRDRVFFVSDLEGTGNCIHERFGPPGDGVCELLYLSNWSRYFFNINDLSCSAGATISAVGDKTSVFFDGVEWINEELPYPITFTRVARCPGGAGGFYAAGKNEAVLDRPELLFHP